jgi:large subunit ribosomal protein LP1
MSISKAEHDELVSVYAALLLHDDNVEITADKLNKVITASGNTVESYYPEFFEKYFQGVNLKTLLESVSAAPAGGVVASAPVEEKKEKKEDKKDAKKKEEPKEEEEEAGGFGDLFG